MSDRRTSRVLAGVAVTVLLVAGGVEAAASASATPAAQSGSVGSGAAAADSPSTPASPSATVGPSTEPSTQPPYPTGDPGSSPTATASPTTRLSETVVITAPLAAKRRRLPAHGVRIVEGGGHRLRAVLKASRVPGLRATYRWHVAGTDLHPTGRSVVLPARAAGHRATVTVRLTAPGYRPTTLTTTR